MNNTLQIFRRLLTFRNCNRIIGLGYGDDRKVNNNSDGKETTSSDVSTVAEPHSQSDGRAYKASSLTTHEAQSSSTKSAQDLTSKEIRNVKDSYTGRISSDSHASIVEGDSEISNTDKREAMTSQFEEINGYGTDSTSKSGENGFLTAFEKQEKLVSEQVIKEKSKRIKPKNTETFASLIRNSPFIDMGDPVGKTVIGEIYLVVENDLYIDFGWKFHTVCPVPRKNPQNYVPGAKVFLKIKDLELSTKFLGEKTHISLLEADCELLGLAFPRDIGQRTEQTK